MNMTRQNKRRVTAALVLTMLWLAVGLWAQDPSAGGVAVRSKAGIGDYLTDSRGMTLYLFTKEIGDQVECSGGCAAIWPPFYAPSITAPSQLNQSDFGTVKRSDGKMQTTYKGWPLYLFAHDTAPGDTNGEGLFKLWYVVRVPFYTVMLANTEALGNFLVDTNGMTLYRFTPDSVDTSTCNAGCIGIWPQEYAATIIVPSTLSASEFGSFTRQDGSEQTTFKGIPLYHFVGDQKPGDANGQGLYGTWFIVNPFTFNP
jgi:predicted lipoprotein with Yx(FWY)xxD motif